MLFLALFPLVSILQASSIISVSKMGRGIMSAVCVDQVEGGEGWACGAALWGSTPMATQVMHLTERLALVCLI